MISVIFGATSAGCVTIDVTKVELVFDPNEWNVAVVSAKTRLLHVILNRGKGLPL